MPDRISHVSDLPEWFDLDKYAQTRNFTILDWYVNFSARIAYTFSERERKVLGDKAILMRMLEAGGFSFDEPLLSSDITLKPNDDIAKSGEEGLEETPSSREQRIFPTVRPITADYIIGMIEETICGSDFGEHLKMAAEQSYEDVLYWSEIDFRNNEHLLANVNENAPNIDALISTQHCPIDDLEAEYGVDLSDGMHIEVDLNSTDKLILADFRSWLKAARKHKKDKRKTEFTEKDMQDWSRYALLPYLDLTIWGRENSVWIPNGVMADALFPDEYEIDCVERIRKVVRDKADRIMFNDLRKIEAQARREN